MQHPEEHCQARYPDEEPKNDWAVRCIVRFRGGVETGSLGIAETSEAPSSQ